MAISQIRAGGARAEGARAEKSLADTTPPVITMSPPVVTIDSGVAYIDTGITASDDVDGDLTAQIQTSGLPIGTSVGVYGINYLVTNAAGLTTSKSRYVHVRPKFYTSPSLNLPVDGDGKRRASSQHVGAQLRAFPGAEGIAALTRGPAANPGGVSVHFVDHLRDDLTAGSFRTAVEGEGKDGRYIIFRCSGNIDLTAIRYCRSNYIYIAGQTSPGGVCITGSTFGFRYKSSPETQTHDIIMRHMRLRGGEHAVPPGDTDNSECFRIWGSEDVMIDQCSFTWGADENIDITSWANATRDPNRITFSRCITAEGLSDAARVLGGETADHGYGMFFVGGFTNLAGKMFEVHNTLFAHCDNRMPLMQGSGMYNLVDNVVYDYKGVQNTYIQFDGVNKDRLHVNLIGHHVIQTADSNPPAPGGNFASGECFSCWGGFGDVLPDDANAYQAIYTEDCFGVTRTTDAAPQWCVVNATTGQLAPTSWQATTKFNFDNVGVPVTKRLRTAATSRSIANTIANEAGATIPLRDAADTRIVNNVLNNTGGKVDRINPPIWASGTADSTHASTLTYSVLSLDADEFVGKTVYNTTTGQSGVISTNAATTIESTIAWTAGDSFIVSNSNYNFSWLSYPDLRTGAPAYPTDSDGDGIPDDYWTFKTGGVTKQWNAMALEVAPQGASEWYLWIEVFLNDLADGTYSYP